MDHAHMTIITEQDLENDETLIGRVKLAIDVVAPLKEDALAEAVEEAPEQHAMLVLLALRTQGTFAHRPRLPAIGAKSTDEEIAARLTAVWDAVAEAVEMEML